MKKSELIEQVAEKAQTSRAAVARVMDAMFDAASGTISEAVQAGQQVSIPGFGKFKPKKRPARKGRNPRTGATIDIPERTVVSFTPGKALRDTLGTPDAKQTRQSGTSKPKSGGTGAKKSGGKAGGGTSKSGASTPRK